MDLNPIDQATFDELKNMVGEEFVGEIIDAFLEDAPHLFNQLETSLAASAIDEFRRAAHSLKSNSASFGALGLSEQAKILEFKAKENDLEGAGEKIATMKLAYQAVEKHLKEIRPNYA